MTMTADQPAWLCLILGVCGSWYYYAATRGNDDAITLGRRRKYYQPNTLTICLQIFLT
jgi:hypothetical protein